MKHLDLFAGIGGFSLGLEAVGMKTVAFCEFDEHAQKVLKKNWPGVPIYNDVRELTNDKLKADGIFPDIITGGFPCQDISVAGNQAGISEETRSGLWSECARLLGEIRPKYAIFENVTALLNGGGGDWFKRVLYDISKVGYDAEWHCIPASELGAHHHRDRIWIIAYPSGDSIRTNARAQPRTKRERKELQQKNREALSNDIGSSCENIPTNTSKQRCNNRSDNRQERHIQNDQEGQSEKVQRQGNQRKSGTSASCEILSNALRERLQRHRESRCSNESIQQPTKPRSSPSGAQLGAESIWQFEPDVGRVADGIPNRSHRLKQLGNAVVPQIPELIGRAIMEIENETNKT